MPRAKKPSKKPSKSALKARNQFFNMSALHAANETLDGGVSIADPVIWRRLVEVIAEEKREEESEIFPIGVPLDVVEQARAASERWQETRPGRRLPSVIETELKSYEEEIALGNPDVAVKARSKRLASELSRATRDIAEKAQEVAYQILAAAEVAEMDEAGQLPHIILRRVNTKGAEAAALAGRGRYEAEMREELGLKEGAELPDGLQRATSTAGTSAVLRYAIAAYEVPEGIEGWIPPPGLVPDHPEGEQWTGSLDAEQARAIWELYLGGAEVASAQAATVMMLAITVIAESGVEELASLKKESALRVTPERALRLLGHPKTA